MFVYVLVVGAKNVNCEFKVALLKGLGATDIDKLDTFSMPCSVLPPDFPYIVMRAWCWLKLERPLIKKIFSFLNIKKSFSFYSSIYLLKAS